MENSLSISPDDTTVAIGRATGAAEVWNLNSLKRVSTLDLPEPASAIDPEWPHETSPRHLQHTENGHLFLLAPEYGLFEFNHVGQQLHSYEPGNSWARALAISPQGKKVAYSTLSSHIFNWSEGGD